MDVYPLARDAHVLLATTTIVLFGLRGVGVLAGARWPMHRPVRLASAAIDTALLAAGATLWWRLGLDPLRDGWLGAKLGLVVVFIVLGSLALKRAPGRTAKALAFVAALACVAAVVAIARAHDVGVPWR